MEFRYLIVNADDFGYCDGVNEGIIKAHQEGIVTSTSVMMNMPAAENGIRRALDTLPQLGLGVHLNITKGTPLSDIADIPDLVDAEGKFRHKSIQIPALSDLPLDQVETELRAQINHFVEVAGKSPTHLDSHHHATLLTPELAQLTTDLAIEYHCAMRNPLPPDRTLGVRTLLDLEIVGAQSQAETIVDNLFNILKNGTVRKPDTFIASFYGARVILGELLNILIEIREGTTELMCHPGMLDEFLLENSDYSKQREVEIESLTHPSVRELLASENIVLISYASLS